MDVSGAVILRSHRLDWHWLSSLRELHSHRAGIAVTLCQSGMRRPGLATCRALRMYSFMSAKAALLGELLVRSSVQSTPSASLPRAGSRRFWAAKRRPACR